MAQISVTVLIPSLLIVAMVQLPFIYCREFATELSDSSRPCTDTLSVLKFRASDDLRNEFSVGNHGAAPDLGYFAASGSCGRGQSA